MQSRTPYWDCPFVSCKKAISLDTIVIDKYFNGVLAELRKSGSPANKIELLPDGTWKPVESNEPTMVSHRINDIAYCPYG
ncbi:E3 SUMO-protein ligase SIZ1-like protein [Aphelenchoides avenae]|nr:E3 SUMO-protein ligase SIZ1-like protein [Aphelenchus avenae]